VSKPKGSVRRVPEEHQRAMVEAYLAGKSAKEAAALFGYCRGSCWSALKKFDCQTSLEAKWDGISEEKQSEILSAYNSGKTMAEVSREFGVDSATCWYIHKKSGSQSHGHPRVNFFKEDYFESIDSEEKAYWLGFITADGHVEKTKANVRMRLGLATKDVDHLERFAKCLDANVPIISVVKSPKQHHKCRDKYKKDYYYFSRVTLSSVKLVDDLMALGVGPRKSLTVRPWSGPDHLMRHYWRGLVDGDGCPRDDSSASHRHQWEISVLGSYWCMAGLAEFVKQHTGHDGRLISVGKIFRLRYRGTNLVKSIAAVLYRDSTVYMPRKKAIADEAMAYESSRRSWMHLTKEDLAQKYGELGTWQAVADSMGLERCGLLHIRRRLGMV
jgi:transposase-like protein